MLSLIANMAGFLLWLSMTNIIIEVFKVAFSAMVIILLMDMIYSTIERNSPELLQAYDPALGGYII